MTAPIEPTPVVPATAPTPQPVAPAAPAPVAPVEPTPFDPKSLSPEAQAWLRQQVDDANYKARTTAKTTAAEEARSTLVQDLAKALGLSKDEPLDPAKLTEQLGQTRQQWEAAEDHAASLAVENDVIRAAVRLGADPDKLLDSQRFCQEVDNLEFTDEADFRAKLDAKIKAAVEKDPTLRLAGQAPARVGADLTGGPGAGGARPTSLGAAVAEAYRQR